MYSLSKTDGYWACWASWGNANIDRVTLSSCFLAKRWANAGNGFHLIRPPHLKQYWFGRALSPKINLDLIKLLLFQYWLAKIWRFALRVTRESAARASPQKCASGPIWTQFLFPEMRFHFLEMRFLFLEFLFSEMPRAIVLLNFCVQS